MYTDKINKIYCKENYHLFGISTVYAYHFLVYFCTLCGHECHHCFQMVRSLYYHVLKTNIYPLFGLKSANVSQNGKDHQFGVQQLSSYIQDA